MYLIIMGLRLLVLRKNVRLSEGDDISLEFNGALRDYQEPVVNKYLERVSNSTGGGGGLLELPCGFGKTSISLYILSQLKKKDVRHRAQRILVKSMGGTHRAIFAKSTGW